MACDRASKTCVLWALAGLTTSCSGTIDVGDDGAVAGRAGATVADSAGVADVAIAGSAGVGDSGAGGNGTDGSSVAGGAGEGGTNAAGAGAMASSGGTGGEGMGGAGGTEGSGGPPGWDVPADCVVPTPEPVAGQAWAIAAVDIRGNTVFFQNVSGTTQALTSEHTWCVTPTFAPVLPPEESGPVNLEPGEFVRVDLTREPLGAFEILIEGNEMALYDSSSVHDDPNTILAFVSWGDGNFGGRTRETVAMAAPTALWTARDRVDIASGHAGIVATGPTNEKSGFTSVPRSCLP